MKTRELPLRGRMMIGSSVLMAGFIAASSRFASNSEELLEKQIGVSADFPERKLVQVQVGEDKEKDYILVVRVDGKLYALGGKCSHFGFPLANGMLFDDMVICPLHLAAFDVKTGFIENGPTMDGVASYQVSEEGGKVVVRIPKDVQRANKPVPTVRRDPANKKRFVIIGGGVAGASAAETLRQSGFTGEILILSAEGYTPYDRSALTKALLVAEPDKIAIRSSSYYTDLGIDIRTGTTVVGVETASKTVETSKGEKISYDKLLVATGSSSVKLQVPGEDLKNIFSIRDFTDVYAVREKVKSAKHVVIVGGGLIGTETASNLKLDLKDGVKVTLISRGAPLQAHFGTEVGGVMQNLASENGIEIVHGSVSRFEGRNLSIRRRRREESLPRGRKPHRCRPRGDCSGRKTQHLVPEEHDPGQGRRSQLRRVFAVFEPRRVRSGGHSELPLLLYQRKDQSRALVRGIQPGLPRGMEHAWQNDTVPKRAFLLEQTVEQVSGLCRSAKRLGQHRD